MAKKSKFRTWLYESGLDIQTFCKIFGISRVTLYRWRKREISPKAGMMMKINKFTKGIISKPEDLLD
jgi:transcriptional regulator with XRE-family HTH domain